MGTPPIDPRAASVSAALAPYGWQRFTAQMLARRTIAVVDAHDLHGLLTCSAGAGAWSPGHVEPVGVDDVRVEPLVAALQDRPWRTHTLDRLASDLVGTLDAWHAYRASFDAGLARILDEG